MSHLIIEIADAKVSDRSGKNKDTGVPYRIVRQKAYAHVGDVYPLPLEISVDWESGAQPYAPGRYTVDAKSFVKGEYGIQLARYVVLNAVQAAQQPQPKQA